MKCNFQKRRGVTLVELAIVIMILSIILTGIFATYFTSITITKKIAPSNGEESQKVLMALENIRSAIANIYFIQGNKRLVFIGIGGTGEAERADKLTFASSYPNSEITMTPEIRETGFYLKKSNKENYSYLIKREDEMVDAYPMEGGIEHPILDYVIGFKLQYSENGTRWEEEWDSLKRTRLPRLVKIKLTVNTEGKEKTYETLAFPGLYIK